MNLGTGIIGGARFPLVMDVALTSDTTPASTMAVNLPAGIVAGEILLLFCNLGGGTASGWTAAFTPSFVFEGCCLWKVADGSEGASVTLTHGFGGTGHGGAVAYRISGGQSVEASAAPASGTSTAPDPASLTPSWGTAKTLWFAAMAANRTGGGGTITVSAAPTGFTNLQQAIGISSFPVGNRMAVAQKDERVSSQDPAAFTMSPSLNWAAYTVAVRP
jgi:hypothetical protein